MFVWQHVLLVLHRHYYRRDGSAVLGALMRLFTVSMPFCTVLQCCFPAINDVIDLYELGLQAVAMDWHVCW